MIDFLYSPICFVNGNEMFYIFASFKQIWITKYTRFVEVTVESDRGCKKKQQKKQANKQTSKQNKTKQNKKISRVESNYLSGTWQPKLSLGRLD